MESTILWEEKREFESIGKDHATAKFTAYLLTGDEAIDKVLIEGTFRVGHYSGYSEKFEWNNAVDTEPTLEVEYAPFNERPALVREMIRRADNWFHTCDLRARSARKELASVA